MAYIIESSHALGCLIRATRRAQDFTRDGLSNATGLSPRFISEVEAGKGTAQLGKVLFLLAELGIRLHADPATLVSPEMLERAAQRRRAPGGGSGSA